MYYHETRNSHFESGPLHSKALSTLIQSHVDDRVHAFKNGKKKISEYYDAYQHYLLFLFCFFSVLAKLAFFWLVIIISSFIRL